MVGVSYHELFLCLKAHLIFDCVFFGLLKYFIIGKRTGYIFVLVIVVLKTLCPRCKKGVPEVLFKSNVGDN